MPKSGTPIPSTSPADDPIRRRTGNGKGDRQNTRKARRRVSSRSIEFGLTQRLVRRIGGGQDPIPGRQSAWRGTVIPPSVQLSLLRGRTSTSKSCRRNSPPFPSSPARMCWAPRSRTRLRSSPSYPPSLACSPSSAERHTTCRHPPPWTASSPAAGRGPSCPAGNTPATPCAAWIAPQGPRWFPWRSTPPTPSPRR